MPTIAIIGALDTKGVEIEFLKTQVEARGCATLVVDVGVMDRAPFRPDVSATLIAREAGADREALAAEGDRGKAVAAMRDGASRLIPKLHREGRFNAILGMGGGAGTSIATAAMRALPLGVPKVMVSTLASGDVSEFVGVKDIVMIPAIVDISGLNRISRQVIAQAAGAICGMVATQVPPGEDKPLIAASMFGNTTPCVETARELLEAAGYEVLVFHATGTGGRTMESLVEGGYIDGVLDVTTTEWADELVGGVLAAGPTRLEAAARTGTPAVVAPGCLDMVNFWAPATIPAQFKDRRFYEHNPDVTLMRTTPDECAELGRIFAEKVNLSTGPVAVYLPLGGVSMIARPGEPFDWPEADTALFGAIKENLRSNIPVHEINADINDPAFARTAADGLLELMRHGKQTK